ncbi:MAG TPA: helix-turn-helix domain-containing protein [Alphaproteobacteria bacterium]
MMRIHVIAGTQGMAQDVAKALQPLWPDAQWQTEQTADADLVLQIGPVESPGTENVPVFVVDTHSAPQRLAHIVRKLKELAAQTRHLDLGDYQLDLGQRLWHDASGKTSDLTEKEVALLHYLAVMHPTPVSREDLLRDVWKYADGADTHTVETHLYRLRQKIEQNPGDPTIVVSTKQGYILGILQN